MTDLRHYIHLIESLDLAKSFSASEDDIELFMNGYCHAFALAVFEKTNWPLIIVWIDDLGTMVPAHVVNQANDGRLVDVRGFHANEDDLGHGSSWAYGDYERSNPAEIKQLIATRKLARISSDLASEAMTLVEEMLAADIIEVARQRSEGPSSTVNEAPIDNFELVGDFSRNSSFRDPNDRKLLTNPKAVEKIKVKWAKVAEPFNMFFVNSPEAGRHTEVGEVNRAWLEQNMPQTLPQLALRDDAVNVIFTNNKGAERVPMTAWIIAHRFGHVILRKAGLFHPPYSFKEARAELHRTIEQIFDEVYGQRFKVQGQYGLVNRDKERLIINLYQEIGTMRSARERALRSEFEFMLELLAQYMLTGAVTFNPLPDSFKHARSQVAVRDREAQQDLSDALETLARDLNYYFSDILSDAVGKIFVM